MMLRKIFSLYRWPVLLTGSCLAHAALLLVNVPAIDMQQLSESTLTVNLSPIRSNVVSNSGQGRHPAAKPIESATLPDSAYQQAPADTPTRVSKNERETHNESVATRTPTQADQPHVANVTTPPVELPTATATPAQPPRQAVTGEPKTQIDAAKSEGPEPDEDEPDEDELDDDDFGPIALQATDPASITGFQSEKSTNPVDTRQRADTVDSFVQASDQSGHLTQDTQLQTAAVESTEPALSAAPAAPTPTKTDSANSSFNASAIRQEIRARFDHDLVYPPLAKKRGWEGNVDVMLRINAQGSIRVLSVVQSSGFGLLDRYTRKTLELIRLDKQSLASLDGGYHDLRIEVQYLLLASRG